MSRSRDPDEPTAESHLDPPSLAGMVPPLTGAGVARLARGTWGALFLWQLVFALGAGAAVAWFVLTCWWPVLVSAAERLPEGEIGVRSGMLVWPAKGAHLLGENAFLAIEADPSGYFPPEPVADVVLTLRGASWRAKLWSASVAFRYPERAAFAMGRADAVAALGAWRGAVGGAVGGVAALGVLFLWWLLATLFMLPARFVRRLLGRGGQAGQLWRTVAAALLGGSVWMDLGIGLYALQIIRVPGTVAFLVLHLLVDTWLMLSGILRLPRADDPEDPFGTESGDRNAGRRRRAQRRRAASGSRGINPFSR